MCVARFGARWASLAALEELHDAAILNLEGEAYRHMHVLPVLEASR